MRTSILRSIISWTLGFALALPLGLCAQPAEEGTVKTAFVYNFIVFTEWPAHALPSGGTIDLCVDADSPIVPFLSVLDGKPIRNYRIRLYLLNSLGIVPPTCRVIYLDRLARKVWPQLRRQLASASVLTISDDSEINASGAMIGLSTQNNRIVFEIDAHEIDKVGLRINTKVLRLARRVR